MANHTWKIILDYHACPKCGKIIESREPYIDVFGKASKDLKCPRCEHLFTIQSEKKKLIGPLFGEATDVEMEWK
jgi:uncharacterized C2H2 Zn-finger protein